MITRLEIDGFKSFADFAVDIPPFVAIVGPNASGKSNMFDAMALLSRIVTMPAAQALAEGRGEPYEQFRRRADGSHVDRIRFAVELLLDADVTDAFGTAERVPHTRMRYEVVVERREDERGVRRPVIASESATPIAKGNDRLSRRAHESFEQAHLFYGASQWKVLATEEHQGKKIFSLKGRRGANPQGRNTLIPAERAVASVLTSVTTALEFPLLYALRQEIARWRFLQLEPSALRMPSTSEEPQDHLTNEGGNLAWVVELIRRSSETADEPGLLALAGDLARVIRGFSGIKVVPNEGRGQWELSLTTRDEGLVSARVASDGTLRLLALLAALYESDDPGVLCLEEPENGINPRRLMALIEVLRDLVTDPTVDDHETDDALVQLLMSSHSPLLSQYMHPSELLVVDTVSLVEPGMGASRITRARRVLDGSDPAHQLELGDEELWAPLPRSAQTDLSGISREVAERIVADE